MKEKQIKIKLLKKAPSSEPLKKRRRPTKKKKITVSSESGDAETEKKPVGRRGSDKTAGRTSGGKKTVVRGARKAAPRKDARGKDARGKDARGSKGASKKRSVSKKPRRGGFDAKAKRGR